MIIAQFQTFRVVCPHVRIRGNLVKWHRVMLGRGGAPEALLPSRRQQLAGVHGSGDARIAAPAPDDRVSWGAIEQGARLGGWWSPGRARGIAYSVLGAGSMAALWLMLGLIWSREVSWMAGLVGGMSGLGMAIGSDGRAGKVDAALAARIAIAVVVVTNLVNFLCDVGLGHLTTDSEWNATQAGSMLLQWLCVRGNVAHLLAGVILAGYMSLRGYGCLSDESSRASNPQSRWHPEESVNCG